ncbi:DUF5133 domain-containing protein [Streptomyces sp. NPDC047434]|uniref:DUF5133 domain-containing protein n=1 Tax=Streptomyces sp. NPDC047434 TaxID=3155143 RepID=UPI0033EDC275
MLAPDSHDIRTMLARYADLRIAQARGERRDAQALRNISRALCDITGSTSIEEALEIADTLLLTPQVRRPRPGVAPGPTASKLAA